MALNRKRAFLKISPGGLNLTQPQDADIPNALLLKNWRAEEDGRLRSTRGRDGAFTETISGTIHTLRMIKGYMYVGASTTLYRVPYGASPLSLVTGLSGSSLFLAEMNGWVWCMNSSAQKRIQVETVKNWSETPPTATLTVADGGAGNITGDNIRYICTFADATGYETNPSQSSGDLNWSATISVTSKKITVASIPSKPAWADRVRIYRIGGGLTDARMVKELFANESTFDDDMANDLTLNYQLLEYDHDPQPAGNGVVEHMGRLVAWINNTIQWTPTLAPWYFPTENYLRLGSSTEDVIRCVSKGNELWVYKERNIWRVVGDLGDFPVPELAWANLGPVGPQAVAEFGNADFFLASDGVYLFDGDKAKRVSSELDPIFAGEAVDLGANPDQLEPMEAPPTNACAVAQAYKNQVWFSYPAVGDTSNTQTVIYDVFSGRWMARGEGYTALNYPGPDKGIMGAISGVNTIQKLDFSDSNDGAAIPLHLVTRFVDFGAPDNQKVVQEVVIEHDTGGATLTVKQYLDLLWTSTTLGTINSSERTVSRFTLDSADVNMGVRCRNIAIGISGDADTAAAASIYSIGFAYQIEPRESAGVRTYAVDWDMIDVKEADSVEIQAIFEVGETFRVKLFADGLDRTWAEVYDSGDVTVSGATDVRRYGFRFTPAYGRLWRMELTYSTPAQVFDAKLKIRAIPNVISGAESSWMTKPFLIA